MPPADGRAGNVCVYLVSCLLFLAILGGGALLVLYIALPESEGTAWFPIAGMVLVGTPWAFWIVTCLYRAASTTAGTVHKDDADRARAPGRDTTPAAVVSTEPGIPAVAAIHQDPVEVNSPGGAARRVRFGAATLLGSPREATAGGSPSGKPDEEPPSSGDGSSHASHESELPLFAAS